MNVQKLKSFIKLPISSNFDEMRLIVYKIAYFNSMVYKEYFILKFVLHMVRKSKQIFYE